MTERLLQFIWRFQYFNKSELSSVSGEDLQIIFPGQYNTNQGPDFTAAKIKIDNTIWAGTVELHIKASDWTKHAHQHDSNYCNVVLHVVWENDVRDNAIPVLELNGRVSKLLLRRYTELMNSTAFIACERSMHLASALTWKTWKERLLIERLLGKSALVENFLRQTGYHWEETFWWLLARNFGIRVNADAFELMARSIPLNILSKHKNQIHQLEALFFGQAGLLEKNPKKIGEEDDYLLLLRKEYAFLRNKYHINPIPAPVYFLRMRPGNFPTIRLAQLAMLVCNSAHLFSKLKEASSVRDIRQWFDVTANDYWHYHYRFNEISAFKKKTVGASMVDNIIVNTVIPMLFSYGNYHDEKRYKDISLQWLEELAAEHNRITEGFNKMGIESKTAYDSQALIELKNEYCERRRCLDCAIGNAILKAKVD